TFITGPGQLAHGVWATNHSGTGTAITSTAKAFSGTRSLALSVGADTPEVTDRAQANAKFSENGSDTEPLTEGFTLRFAFLRTSADFTSTFYLTGGGGQSVLIYISNNLDVYHHDYHPEGTSNRDRHRIAITLQANTWYQFEITMPTLTNNPNPEYTVTLYDAAGQWLADSTGALYNTGITNYNLFTFYHVTPNKTFYIDNVTVTPIPEPATTALLVAGLGIGLLWQRSRR
ncbi:MAG TPA: PEP-CTERM sorting domain-containing protein, partial [Chthoniobacteraceae bacterium]|nr:PEP-CTERM sorting domain-containing protein [Chthoniobacteraceae bacterium]